MRINEQNSIWLLFHLTKEQPHINNQEYFIRGGRIGQQPRATLGLVT